MRRYRYHRYHYETGQRSVGEMDAESLHAVLVHLNDYNRRANGRWQYWIEDADMMGWPV